MAKEKTPWFLANDSEPEDDDTPSPQFNADEMEFESFMFDPGAGATPRQSGPLASGASPVAAVGMSESGGIAVAQVGSSSPFTGSEVPRRDSGPLPPRQSGPLLRKSGPLSWQSSKPLASNGSLDQHLSEAEAYTSGGLHPLTDPTPLRYSGPLIDGRTTTGSLTMNDVGKELGRDKGRTARSHSTDPLDSVEPKHASTGPIHDDLQPPAMDLHKTGPGFADQVWQGEQLSLASDSKSLTEPEKDSARYFSGWTDGALASVEDFSAVLIALDGGRRYRTSGPLTLSTLQLPADGQRSINDALSTNDVTGWVATSEIGPPPTGPQMTGPQMAAHTADDALGQTTSSPDDDPGGSFKANDLEFESFMFDRGTASQGMENQAAQAQAHAGPGQPSGSLPFWLRNTGDLEAQPVTDYMNVIGVTPGSEVSQATDQPTMTEEEYEKLYADLPPIEPFDFAAVALPENEPEDEFLGFSAGELSGFEMPQRNSITATTDLQAVAAMMGNEALGEEQPEPAVSGQWSVVSGQYDDQTQGNEGSARQMQAETSQHEEGKVVEASVSAAGWTATATSALSAEAAHDREMPTGEMVEDDFGLDDMDMDLSPFSFTELGLEDDEAPTEQLASGHLASGALNKRISGPLGGGRGRISGPLASLARITGPLAGNGANGGYQTGEETGTNGRRYSTGWLGNRGGVDSGEYNEDPDEATGALSLMTEAFTAAVDEVASAATRPAVSEAPDSAALESKATDEEVESVGKKSKREKGANKQTASLEPLPEPVVEEKVVEMAAPEAVPEELRMDSVEPLEEVTHFSEVSNIQKELEAPTYEAFMPAVSPPSRAVPAPPAPVEAKVQRGAQTKELVEPASRIEPVPAIETEAVEKAQVYAQTSGQSAVPFPASLLASGPLPELEGFDEVRDWVAAHPDDLGAQMALAAAYAQVGDIVTELRVYRRVLRKSNLSSNILRLVAEELSDCEHEMLGHPQFHQVRGDLYMRQSRFQEAIAEYNKII